MPELDEMSSACFTDDCDECAKDDCTCMCHDVYEPDQYDEPDPASDPSMQHVTAVCANCSIVEVAWWNGEGVPACASCGQPFSIGVAT